MVAPSLISHRRFDAPLRHRLQVAYARAWEALTETHRTQAARFARQLSGRLSLDEALQRYFHEVAVPPLMRETVRAGVLIEVGDDPGAFEEPASDDAAPDLWSYLHPAMFIEAVRRRARFVEETNLAAQLAASLAVEAVTVTHVRAAGQVAEILGDVLPVDEAIMHYVRSFDLPTVEAQMVFQRTLAAQAEQTPPLAPLPLKEDMFDVREPFVAPARVPRPSQVAVAAYGLRAIS